MANEIENIISDGLKRLGEEITLVIREKDLVYTGASQDFEVKTNGNKVELWGEDYLYFLDKGRGPGKFPPVDVMLNYVQGKGISIIDENTGRRWTDQQTAYVIGRSIAEKGTAIYQDNTKGINLDQLIEDELNVIYDKLPDAVVAEAKKIIYEFDIK